MYVAFFFFALAVSSDFVIDFREIKSHEIEVDMASKSGVEIILPSSTAPEIAITNGPLAECTVDSLVKVETQTYRFRVRFDPVLDDGANGCSVKILSSGRVRRVNLGIFLDT